MRAAFFSARMAFSPTRDRIRGLPWVITEGHGRVSGIPP